LRRGRVLETIGGANKNHITNYLAGMDGPNLVQQRARALLTLSP